MSIKSDKWIKRMASTEAMIEPLNQVKYVLLMIRKLFRMELQVMDMMFDVLLN